MTNNTEQRILNSLAQAKCGGHPRVSCELYTEHVGWLLTELQAARRMLELMELRERLRDQKTK